MSGPLESVEAKMRRLMAGMQEMDRLDKAAGEHAPGLTISEWVKQRMQEAAKAKDHLND